MKKKEGGFVDRLKVSHLSDRDLAKTIIAACTEKAFPEVGPNHSRMFLLKFEVEAHLEMHGAMQFLLEDIRAHAGRMVGLDLTGQTVTGAEMLEKILQAGRKEYFPKGNPVEVNAAEIIKEECEKHFSTYFRRSGEPSFN